MGGAWAHQRISANNACGRLRPSRKHNKIGTTLAKLVRMPMRSNFRELVTTARGRKVGAERTESRADRDVLDLPDRDVAVAAAAPAFICVARPRGACVTRTNGMTIETCTPRVPLTAAAAPR